MARTPNTVVHFECGVQTPHIAFVGEAPSDEEMLDGRPFVGPSGRLFDTMLRIAGIERSTVWVGNLFEEQAPNNNCDAWLADPAKLHPALDRLNGELERARPNVIVPLGATALSAFLGQTSISSARGSTQLSTGVAKGRKVLPTYHPSFILYGFWKYYTIVISDFQRVADEGEYPEIRYPRRRLTIAPLLDDIRAFHRRAQATGQPVGLDIETGFGQITCIGFSIGEEEAICVPFVDTRKPSRSYWGSVDFEMQAWNLVKAICEDPCLAKVGQNFAGYDWLWLLWQKGIHVLNFSEDTRLLHHALYPELPKDLEFMGASYTRQGPWKGLGWRGTEKKDD